MKRLPAGGVLIVVSALAVACGERAPPERPAESGVVADPNGSAVNTPLPQAALGLSRPESLVARGEAAYSKGEWESAQQAWNLAVKQLRAAGDRAAESRVLTSLGLAAWRLGDYSRARILGEKALAIKIELGLAADQFKSYNALGLLAWNQGRLDEASEMFRKAASVAQAQGDEESLAKVVNNSGLVQTERGDFESAQRGFDEAARIAQKLANPMIEGRARNNLGMLAVRLGNPLAAVSELRRARSLYHIAADATGEQNALGQLGAAYDAMGESRLALAALDTALRLSRDQGLRAEEASNLELLAGIHRFAGRPQHALRLYADANLINAELELAVERGTNLRSTAEIQADLGRSDLAREAVFRALEIHRSSGVRLEEMRDLLLLARLEADRAQSRTAAKRHLAQAGGIAASLGARIARAEVALASASIASNAGDFRVVLRILDRAAGDLRGGGIGSEWVAAAMKMRAYAGLSMLDSAAASGRIAVAALERARNRFGSGVLRTSFAAERVSVYADLVDILLQRRLVEEALEIADAARNRALVENVPAAGTTAGRGETTIRAIGESEAILRRIDALVARLDALDETPVSERDGERNAMVRSTAAALSEARSSYESHLIRVAERDPVAGSLLGSRRVNVREVQAALKTDETLIEYLVAPERLYVFVVNSETVRSMTVDIRAEDLSRRVRMARDLLQTNSSAANADSAVLSRLHSVLIGPAIRSRLLDRARRLIIVPHASLSYLPFSALRDSRNGRYLMQDYSLLHLPLAAALEVLRRRSSIVSADHSEPMAFAPFARELPGSAREVRAFGRIMPGSRRIVGDQATERRLREALSHGGIVHVATHGMMNARNPMFSRIAMSRGTGSSDDDGRLEVHEVLSLNIRAPVVFLSGCETGLGAAWATQFATGEDYSTLSQAFLYAGTKTVAATLWRIGDTGAAAFATSFYAKLSTMEPAEALAGAQRELLKDKRLKRPYYWAGYQVTGVGAGLRSSHKPRPASVSRSESTTRIKRAADDN